MSFEQTAPRLTAVASPILRSIAWNHPMRWTDSERQGGGEGSSSRMKDHLNHSRGGARRGLQRAQGLHQGEQGRSDGMKNDERLRSSVCVSCSHRKFEVCLNLEPPRSYR
jgi:hypothetical protein